jgi:hypothetical protein
VARRCLVKSIGGKLADTVACLPARLHYDLTLILTAGLSFLLFLAGLCTIGTAAWIITAGYSPTPSLDHWVPLYDLAKGYQWHSLSWLWHPHNEHRIPLLRLAIVSDVYWFGGRSVLLFALTFVTLLLHASAWAVFLKRAANLPLFIWMSAVGVFVYSICAPYQFENFIWAFEWTFVVCFFFATIAFLAFASFSFENRPWAAVVSASIMAFLSEASLASGLIVWPILWLASFAVPIRRKHRIVLSGLGVIAIAAFLFGYYTAGHSPIQSLRQPGRLLQYLLTYFDHWFTNFVTYPAIPAVLGLLLGLAAMVFLVWHADTRCLGIGLASTQLFLLGTGFLTALGRVRAGGIGQAASSRYQAPAMLFWACIFCALVIAAWQLRSWRDVITLNLIGLLVVASQISYIRDMSIWLPTRTYEVSSRGEAIDQGAAEPWLDKAMVIGMPMIVPAMSFLHQLNDHIAPSTLKGFVQNVKELPQNRNVCQGVFDSVTPLAQFYPGGPKEVRVDGWALTSRRIPADGIVITGDRGQVLAMNRLQFSRPDVRAAVPKSKGLAGWLLYVPVPAGVSELRAFALVDDQFCPVGIPRRAK